MTGLVADIWHSFRGLPIWVQIWVAAVLVPISLLSLLFLNVPFGSAVAGK